MKLYQWFTSAFLSCERILVSVLFAWYVLQFHSSGGYVWDSLMKYMLSWGVALWWKNPGEIHALSISKQAPSIMHALWPPHTCVSHAHTLTRSIQFPHTTAMSRFTRDLTEGRTCWRAKPELGRREWPISHPGKRKQSHSKKVRTPERRSSFFFFLEFQV